MIEFEVIREVMSMLGDAALLVLVLIIWRHTSALISHHTRLTVIETILKLSKGKDHGKT